MKTHRIAAASIVSAVVLVGALAAIAQQATQRDQTPTNQNRVAANPQSDSARSIGKLDEKTAGATVRASQLIGANLQNSAGDSVGEINDLVLDGSGKVRYAAVTYGGVLGVGSKLFTVPFEAFKVKMDPDDANEDDADDIDYVLTLDVTKDQLDGAQGFDSDKWPDFADTKFTQELDRRYNVNRNQSRTPNRQ